MKRFLIAGICAVMLLFSGCAAHVDTQGASFAGLSTQSFNGCSFLVPDTALNEAVDYHTITDVEYATMEKRDEAIVSLIQSAIMGTSDTGYLLTKSREYMFYVTKVDAPAVSLVECNRDELVNLIGRSDLSFIYYGRGVANEDDAKKAVIRVDFRVADALGADNTFNGYYGIAEVRGSYFVYLAGYKNATEAQLTQCFNCVRSMT